MGCFRRFLLHLPSQQVRHASSRHFLNCSLFHVPGVELRRCSSLIGIFSPFFLYIQLRHSGLFEF
ncbi:hypothetical protein QJS10_CPB14g01705 [Acorus calamus]|uniref:Uncharacterized protein n=1 Tax=Acorus calamus TaxID=4465 RepID=A0AAV9DBV8_ACOCL|nr:hypothetical protein QJS10_CPB14g01705 [Acorus calamus]